MSNYFAYRFMNKSAEEGFDRAPSAHSNAVRYHLCSSAVISATREGLTLT